MIVLAIETATRVGSLALAVDGVCHAREGRDDRSHAERLPLEAEAFLAEHGRTLADVDLFAVIAGPGSFTGIRVGVAAVQGLALASGRRVVAAPTLEAMADAWIVARSGPAAIVLACVDGQRGEFFYGGWRTAAGLATAAGAVVPPRAGSLAELESAIANLPPELAVEVVGLRGSALAAVADRLQVAARWSLLPVPLAEPAARLAVARPDLAVPPHAVRPIYLRKPDAEIARARAGFATVRLQPTDDLSAVEALQRRSFTNPWGAEAIRWELANTDVARLYKLTAPGDTLAGYCACWLLFDELHINSLAIDEPWRRRRLARRLLADVFREAVGAGARSATLEVRQSNRAARALYEGLGFTVEAVRRDYYQSPREDALILWHRRLAERSWSPD